MAKRKYKRARRSVRRRYRKGELSAEATVAILSILALGVLTGIALGFVFGMGVVKTDNFASVNMKKFEQPRRDKTINIKKLLRGY